MIKEKNIVSVSEKSLGNLIVIDLRKDGLSASFVFDTGASITVVNRTTAEKFGAQETQEKVKGGGTAGIEQEIKLSTFSEIKLGEYSLPAKDFIVVEDEVLKFGQDENGNDLQVDGFLGWDIISNLRWEYNHENLEFCFGESVTNENKMIFEDWNNMPLLNIIVDKKNRVFGFDSGHTESIIGSLLYPNYKHIQSVNDDFVGIDGKTTEEVKIAEKVELEINNVKIDIQNVSVVDRNVFPTSREDVCGLLGIDIVENRSWILDYPNRNFEIL